MESKEDCSTIYLTNVFVEQENTVIELKFLFAFTVQRKSETKSML